MGVKVKHEDRIRKFIVANDIAIEACLQRMAEDILRVAKTHVPRKQNTLTKSGQVEKGLSANEVYVTFGNDGSDAADYASVQEQGHRNGIPFVNYTSPGTGAHYLKNAGDKIMLQSLNYIRQALGRLTRGGL